MYSLLASGDLCFVTDWAGSDGGEEWTSVPKLTVTCSTCGSRWCIPSLSFRLASRPSRPWAWWYVDYKIGCFTGIRLESKRVKSVLSQLVIDIRRRSPKSLGSTWTAFVAIHPGLLFLLLTHDSPRFSTHGCRTFSVLKAAYVSPRAINLLNSNRGHWLCGVFFFIHRLLCTSLGLYWLWLYLHLPLHLLGTKGIM